MKKPNTKIKFQECNECSEKKSKCSFVFNLAIKYARNNKRENILFKYTLQG